MSPIYPNLGVAQGAVAVGGRIGLLVPGHIEPQGVREPQIAKVMERQGRCLDEHDQALLMLEKRLELLLDPPAPMANETDPPRPVRCPLGSSIDDHSDRIHSMTMRARSLLERLAV